MGYAGESRAETLERMRGNAFVTIMRNMPYFFEKNGLDRPDSLRVASYAESSDSDDDAKYEALAITASVLAVAFLVAGCWLIARERMGRPVFYKELAQSEKTSKAV